jgi:hypothetical protein
MVVTVYDVIYNSFICISNASYKELMHLGQIDDTLEKTGT